MNQNIKGISSTQKINKISHLFNKKSNSPQVRKIHSPKGIKVHTIGKQNPISPQTQPFTELDTVKQQYRKIQPSIKNVKPKINLNQSKSPKINNDYAFNNSNNQSKKKMIDYGKIENQLKSKILGNSTQKSLIKSQSPMIKLKSPRTKNLQLKKTLNTTNQYINNLSSQYNQKQENQQSFQSEYKQQNNSKQQIKHFPNRLKRNNSIQSNSSQNSYYGIVAQYRRKRFQKSTELSQGKMSLQNSVADSIQENSHKMLQRTKSVEYSIIRPSELYKQGRENGQNVDKKFGFRPRIGTSVSSKSQIKSSQSNLSNSSKNKIEQKVIMMKNHLKQRKPSINLSKNKNDIKNKNSTQTEVQYRVKHNYQPAEYKEKQRNSQKPTTIQLLDYKNLYQQSMNKLKTVSKQLEVQKKKNEITRQIYKSQIDKLKRQKSSQHLLTNSNNLNDYNKKYQEQILVTSFITNTFKKATHDEQFKEQKCNNQNSIIDLKNRLKNSHLFTYQAFQSIIKTNKSSTQSKKSPFGLTQQKQNTTNSILIPNNQFQQNQQNNQTHDMIVQLSQQLRQSALHSQTLWKSKISTDKYKINEIIKQSRDKSQLLKESIILPQLSFNKKNNQLSQVREITFKQLDCCEKNYDQLLKSQSLLLDLSSNFNNTKSFFKKQNGTKNDDDQESILLDSFCLQTKEFKIAENMDESKYNDENQFIDFQYHNGSYEKDQNMRKKSTTKRIPIKMNFIQDSLNKNENKISQSQYDSTSSQNMIKNKHNSKKIIKDYFQD